MANNPLDQLKDVLSAPLGELISAIGKGVGEAQAALDEGSLNQTMALYNQANNTEMTKLLREIGYQPTFYVLPETEVEAQISLSFSMNAENTNSGNATQNKMFKTQVSALPINASNVNKFNLNGSAFAKIKFKVVPVPPPTTLNEIRVLPELSKMTIDTAIAVLDSLGLGFVLADENVDRKKLIKSQEPAAATYLKVGDTVQLFY